MSRSFSRILVRKCTLVFDLIDFFLSISLALSCFELELVLEPELELDVEIVDAFSDA